ncbi:MAG: ATP synthase subunit I [Janthinobacterium lividum]
MNDPMGLVFAFAMGGALGAVFFGGLWWTVLRGLASPVPALWFFISLLLRTGITVAGFLLVSCGHWERVLACLLSFFIARIVVAKLTRTPAGAQGIAVKETSHAS